MGSSPDDAAKKKGRKKSEPCSPAHAMKGEEGAVGRGKKKKKGEREGVLTFVEGGEKEKGGGGAYTTSPLEEEDNTSGPGKRG